MKPHVLILEDNFLLAENLAEIVQEDLKGEPLPAAMAGKPRAEIISLKKT
jgi:hypothetical protein